MSSNLSAHLRQRAAVALAIGALVIGSVFTWKSYLDASVPPYTDSDYQEMTSDQDRVLRNVFNRYTDLIEAQDPEAARLFYKEHGERSKSEIRDRLAKFLMGYVDKYGNVHGYRVTNYGQLSISSDESERKRLVVFNCDWLKTSYRFTREDCRQNADDLGVTHPLKGLIEEETRLLLEKIEKRWLSDKETASIEALHHFIWTLTASLLFFVIGGLLRRLRVFKRGVTPRGE